LTVPAVTVNVAGIDAPLYEAVMTTAVGACTVEVSMENVAARDPPATVTLEGTFATFVLLLASCTTAPPEGAVFANVTVP
jgi:hypothetical protein